MMTTGHSERVPASSRVSLVDVQVGSLKQLFDTIVELVAFLHETEAQQRCELRRVVVIDVKSLVGDKLAETGKLFVVQSLSAVAQIHQFFFLSQRGPYFTPIAASCTIFVSGIGIQLK